MMNELIDGKYEIISKIGSGGTSIVYQARRLSDGKIVAVKVIREELEDIKEQERHFRLEAEALAHMSHKNIRRIFAVGQWNDSLYMVTEYIDGKTLKDIINTKGPLSSQKALDYALQITAGIEHAHLKNIIHRDIKPQNVIVANDGTVKIVDFGIARMLSHTTRTMGGKDVVGSVHYISPEQARGAQVDSRTDIYSFGILLYEMFTGKVPFTGEEAVTIAMKHVNEQPAPPKTVNPSLLKGINDIIMKCIQKDPQRRYQTASELREDLLLFAANPEGFTVISDTRERTRGERGNTERTLRKTADDTTDTPRRRNPERTLRGNAEDFADKDARKRSSEESVKKRVTYVSDDERKKVKHSKRKKTAVIIGAVAVSAVAVVLVIALLIPLLFGDGKYPQKPLPDVIGLSKQAAGVVLHAEEFSKFKWIKESATDVPEGAVIRTEPEPHTVVKVNTEIKIYISSGAKSVLPENIIGKTSSEAVKILEGQGFKVQFNYVEDMSKENGLVIDQTNTTQALPVGSEITITVIRNIQAEKIVVPDLSSCKTIDEAKKKITEAGFQVGKYREEKIDDPAKFGVGYQFPAAGTEYIYINGQTPPEVEIEFTIYISNGFHCTYDYALPNDETADMELIVYNSDGDETDYRKYDSANHVTYVYDSEIIEDITFELYSGSRRIDKQTIRTASQVNG